MHLCADSKRKINTFFWRFGRRLISCWGDELDYLPGHQDFDVLGVLVVVLDGLLLTSELHDDKLDNNCLLLRFAVLEN